jgi:hypothetical protein
MASDIGGEKKAGVNGGSGGVASVISWRQAGSMASKMKAAISSGGGVAAMAAAWHQ